MGWGLQSTQCQGMPCCVLSNTPLGGGGGVSPQYSVVSQPLFMSLVWFRVAIGSIWDSLKSQRRYGGRQLGLSHYPTWDTLSPIGFTRLSRLCMVPGNVNRGSFPWSIRCTRSRVLSVIATEGICQKGDSVQSPDTRARNCWGRKMTESCSAGSVHQ